MRTATALAPWFGSNRLLAHHVGELLAGRDWVGVPFAGGMSELTHIDARTVVVGDLHRHLINLARVVASDELRPVLMRHLRRALFHPDELDAAQEWCKCHQPVEGIRGDLQAAYSYFVCVWMGRSHLAGTKDEFTGRLSTRWNASGGDSNVRYRSAVRSLVSFGRTARRCTFSVMDAFDFLGRCDDKDRHGVYCDPPFPGAGADYRHNAGKGAEEVAWHTRLRDSLVRFGRTRVVLRYYRHPLVEELYPPDRWDWRELTGGRTQANKAAPEVLILNRTAEG